jgi:hypothetical protein
MMMMITDCVKRKECNERHVLFVVLVDKKSKKGLVKKKCRLDSYSCVVIRECFLPAWSVLAALSASTHPVVVNKMVGAQVPRYALSITTDKSSSYLDASSDYKLCIPADAPARGGLFGLWWWCRTRKLAHSFK